MKTKILLAGFFTLIASAIIAQKWDAVKHYGDGAINQPISYGIDKDKNTYVAVNNWYFSCGTCTNNFSYNLLHKINEQGIIEWTDTLPSLKWTMTDKDGNTFVLLGTGISKINNIGVEVWQTNDSDAVYFRGALHPSGDIIVYGRHTTNAQANKTIISRFDKNGNRIWSRKGDYFLADIYAHPITTDNIGNIYLAGGTDALNTNNQSLFLTKFDQNGNVIFASKILEQYVRHLAVDNSQSIYVANLGKYTKFDNQGNLLWTKTLSMNNNGVIGAGHEFFVATDSDNNVFFSFIYNKNVKMNNDFSLSCNYHNMLVAKYDSEGNFQWVKETQGDQGSVSPHGFQITKSNEITLLAELSSLKDLDAYHIKSKGYKDILLVTIKDELTTSIDKNSFVKSEVTVFPNPSGSIFTVSSKSASGGSYEIRVVNLLGAVVLSKKLESNGPNITFDLDLRNFAKGAYFLTLQFGATTETKKVILE